MNLIDITSISDDKVSVFVSSSEPQLRHYRDPDGGIFIAESCKVMSAEAYSKKKKSHRSFRVSVMFPFTARLQTLWRGSQATI